MTVLLLTLGFVVGTACAALLARAGRARRRDELKSISVDVLAQTGDSLARRLRRLQRRPRRSAPRGEMARRSEEIKGSWRPCRRSSADGERDRPPGARAPPGPRRARADGAHARRRRRHAAPGDRQPRLGAEAAFHARLVGRDPAAQRGRDGRHGRPLRLPRAAHDRRRRRRCCARTCSCACRAAS